MRGCQYCCLRKFGESLLGVKLPLTLGHNNAGYVAAVGADVSDFNKGDVVLGLAGGMLPCSFQSLPWECVVTNSIWGSYKELREVQALAAAGKLKSRVQRFPLDNINIVLDNMRRGQMDGQAVITP